MRRDSEKDDTIPKISNSICRSTREKEVPSLWLNRVESPSPLYVLLVESAQSLVSLTSPSSSQNVNVCCVGVF